MSSSFNIEGQPIRVLSVFMVNKDPYDKYCAEGTMRFCFVNDLLSLHDAARGLGGAVSPQTLCKAYAVQWRLCSTCRTTKTAQEFILLQFSINLDELPLVCSYNYVLIP